MAVEPTLDERIAQWREFLQRQRAISPADAKELEDTLRSHIEVMRKLGLSEEEAFLIAVKRTGEAHPDSLESTRLYSGQLWKQLTVPTDTDEKAKAWQREALVAVGLAVGAGIAMKVPSLFGYHIGGSPDSESFYIHNISLLILPLLAAYLAWKREMKQADIMKLALPFLGAALVINIYPFVKSGSTETLAALHLPNALWFAVGIAYMGGFWNSFHRRMNFVRFTGEWFIYMVLIALGGGVFMGFTFLLFKSIGLDAEPFVQSWLMPCGVAGAVVIAGWLVEAKQSIIENMAPVLTRLFTPLFTILLASYLAAMIFSGRGILVDREVLIAFDLLLLLILGLLFYSISARDSEAPPNLFDRLQFVLVVCALAVDGFALWAVGMRISEFGFSPNKVAALGENLILLVNLGGSALLYARFLFKRGSFASLERWQTGYIPIYPVWAAFVVVGFPLIFGFE
jgi:hypothetical protein